MNQEPLPHQPSQQQSVGDINSHGNDNILNVIQGNDVVLTFNKTKIIQISVDEIQTREFKEASPYKGLRGFETVDKDLFFGRDLFLKGLVNALEQTNLILLLGASGSGKSSVVRAGLIPWLSKKWNPNFIDLTFTPDRDPFNSLYYRLHDRYQQTDAQFILEGKVDTLTQAVTKIKPQRDFWFIFIDQFEELFTLSPLEVRDRFIKSLTQLVNTLTTTQNQSIKIVATMRADFLDRLSPYPELIKATDKRRPMIAEMQMDELRLAIEQPAAHHGVIFETGLVEEIIKDVLGQAGCLPLLQYTLNLLWETEVQTGSIYDRTLNVSNYRNLGGVRGALQKHTDEVYERLPESEQLAAQRILLKLIEIGGNVESGTEWKPVRRRANRSEFDDPLEQKVLAQLINKKLLVSNRETESQEATVEIAHEILLTSWTSLNIWIRSNRQAITIRNRLNDDVARWQVKQKDDELWGGSKLEQALELRENSTFNKVLGGFTPTANQFIDASLKKRDRELEILKQLKEDAEARAAYEKQKRRLTRQNWFLTSGLLAAIAVAAFISSWLSQQNARTARQGEVETLVELAEERFDNHQQLEALDTSIKALATLKKSGLQPDAYLKRLQPIVSGVQERNRWEAHNGGAVGLSIAPRIKTLAEDKRLIASSGKDGTVKLWTLEGKYKKTLTQQKSLISKIQFSRTGELLAAISYSGDVLLWKMPKLERFFIPKQESPLYGLAFNSDDSILAYSTEKGKIELWKTSRNTNVPLVSLLATQFLPKKYQNSDYHIYGLAFSPTSKNMLAYGGDGGFGVWLWKSRPGKSEPMLLGKHSKDIIGIAFSPDGKKLASCDLNGSVKIWSTESSTSKKPLLNFKASSKSLFTVKFNADSTLLATAGDDQVIRIWDLQKAMKPHSFNQAKDALMAEIKGHTGAIYEVNFLNQINSDQSNSEKLISASNDGTIREWNWKIEATNKVAYIEEITHKACSSIKDYIIQDAYPKSECLK